MTHPKETRKERLKRLDNLERKLKTFSAKVAKYPSAMTESLAMLPPAGSDILIHLQAKIEKN